VDTIQQILQSDAPPELICHSPAHPVAWVHLTAPTENDALSYEAWIITCGSESPDAQSVLAALTIKLAPKAHLELADSGLFAVIQLPGSMPAEAVAEIIIRIMFDVQHVPSPNGVELSLEYR